MIQKWLWEWISSHTHFCDETPQKCTGFEAIQLMLAEKIPTWTLHRVLLSRALIPTGQASAHPICNLLATLHYWYQRGWPGHFIGKVSMLQQYSFTTGRFPSKILYEQKQNNPRQKITKSFLINITMTVKYLNIED